MALRRGFTLIEMAVVMVVMGLLLMVSLPFFTEKISQEKVMKGRENVTALKREVIGFALTNGYLPALHGTTDQDVEEMANSLDAWDNPIAYWSDPDITGSGNNICDLPASNNNLRVDDDGTTYNDIAFVIAGRGPNFNLQVDEDSGGGAPNPRIIETYAYQTNTDEVNDDLDHGSVSYDLPADRDEPFDDMVQYVSIDYLKGRLCSGEEDDGPIGAEVSFAEDIEQFGGSGGSTYADSGVSSVPTISVDADTGEMKMQTDEGQRNNFGCSWYQGGNGNCGTAIGRADDDGVCQFGSGLRVFFRSKVKRKSDGGFTFTVLGYEEVSGTNDQSGAALADLCGGDCGNMGYSSRGDGGSTDGLYPPKLGVAFDFWGSTSGNHDEANELGRPRGSGHNSISLVYWRGEASLSDDLRHDLSAGGGDLGNPNTPPGSSSGGPPPDPQCDDADIVYCNYGTDEWIEDGEFYPIRMDIVRDTANDTIVTYFYYNCTSTDCRNLTADYFTNENPADFDFKLNYNAAVPAAPTDYASRFALIRMGFTMGDCGGGEGFGTTISDFGLTFR